MLLLSERSEPAQRWDLDLPDGTKGRASGDKAEGEHDAWGLGVRSAEGRVVAGAGAAAGEGMVGEVGASQGEVRGAISQSSPKCIQPEC
jgi:hypothetical protein